MRHNCPRCLSDIDLSLSLSLQKAMMDAQNALKKKRVHKLMGDIRVPLSSFIDSLQIKVKTPT